MLHGESGYIFVSSKEIEAIADFLKLDFEHFVKNLLRKLGIATLCWIFHRAMVCICVVFFKDGMCQIYSKRPRQCVTFPFWDYYKEHFEELSKECIGVVQK